ncbi:gamma-glutamyltransferase [Alphaproteobacteria bacterium 46_93_T64]|nr:gamma-glutamyltransferase [Alphaproteobacteria bacterium 46_93_T64]
MVNSRQLFQRAISISVLFVAVVAFALNAAANTAGKYMIAAANPLAAEAGYDVLAKGGNAVDAAIAVQLVLTLVEPQSSGIGGGAFLLYYDNKKQEVSTYDGREMAPAAVTENHFLKTDGKPLKFYEAVVGGKSVGVPGALAMLEKAHKERGQLPWKSLFDAAIVHSKNGFAISPRLHFLLNRDKYLKTKSAAATYFYNTDGTAKEVGTILKNPELAATFRDIAANGAKALYEGSIASKIVQAVKSDIENSGVLTLADMKNYVAKKRMPVCAPYHGYKVCGMGPPTSGGVTSLQILKLLEKQNLSTISAGSANAINLISEASALAFADRGLYLADKDFVDVPVDALLSPTYIKRRSALIRAGETHVPYTAGDPAKQASTLMPDNAIELPSTSHFSIVDANGNAVSMTTSVENVFGSRLMAGGFILNNQLTDFSFRPSKDGVLVNNRIQAGKRPRSSMSPTLVLNADDTLNMAIGSPGGSRIIGFVTKTIIGVLDWGLDMQSAINLPHHINRNGTLDLEKDTAIADHKTALEAMGYKVKIRTLNSGLHGIRVTAQGLQGGADPRREGVVLGN